MKSVLKYGNFKFGHVRFSSLWQWGSITQSNKNIYIKIKKLRKLKKGYFGLQHMKRYTPLQKDSSAESYACLLISLQARI